MFKSRIENYWITRPDTLHMGHICDLNQFLAPYEHTLQFSPCDELPDFGLIQSPKSEAQAILDILANNSLINRYIINFITAYIEQTPLTLTEYKAQQNYLDLDKATCFQDFLQFITHPNIKLDFADSTVETMQPACNWIEGNPHKLLSYYQQFFMRSDILYQQYSAKQLNDSLWFIFSHYDYGLEQIIYDSRIDFDKRKQTVASIYELYAKLFIHDPIEHHRYMLWDGLAFSYTMDHFNHYFKDDEKEPLQDVMFNTLADILQLPNKGCQFAALHGLNHLRHPDTHTLIHQYIDTHDDLDDEDIEFAKACIQGTVM